MSIQWHGAILAECIRLFLSLLHEERWSRMDANPGCCTSRSVAVVLAHDSVLGQSALLVSSKHPHIFCHHFCPFFLFCLLFFLQLNHGWTSMKGRAVFWYRLRRQGEEIIAEVHFKLYGQRCDRCCRHTSDDAFLTPLWYYEEIENAMRFLSTHVCRTYYGGHKVSAPQPLRQGRTRGLHNPTRCQACSDGICTLAN